MILQSLLYNGQRPMYGNTKPFASEEKVNVLNSYGCEQTLMKLLYTAM